MYDVEVFQYDALIVIWDLDYNEVIHCWSSRERRDDPEHYLDHPSGFEPVVDIVKKNTLCGYNNYGYDDYILTMMMNPVLSTTKLIKALNDRIISGKGSTIKVDKCIDSIDAMQQIDVSHPSLKQIEGNLGRSIVETSIDFTTNHPLSDEEREEVLKYCRYDVKNTIDVYKMRIKSYFETKEALIQMLPEEERQRAQRWNTTTISAKVLLGDGKLPIWDRYRVPEKYWRNVDGIPDTIWDMWEASNDPNNYLATSKSKSFMSFGCKVVMGFGGLHGAPVKPDRYERVLLADVGSMYPTLIVMMEALGEATETYNQIRLDRLKIKHTDKVRANAMKLLLNSVYGLFKSEYSALFNPLAGSTVCIYGQIALFTLCKMLYNAGYRIVNINTDGVAFEDNGSEVYKDILLEWEQEFTAENGVGMKLEIDEFDRWIQKDVNNYIALQGGHIKTKGGEVNKYREDRFFANNNLRIAQIAMVDYLVSGKPVFDTLMENLDKPLLWQYVLKAGSTFQGVRDHTGEFVNKVNRVFAANETAQWTYLKKVRADGSDVSFPDVPERMLLWNEDVNDIPDFSAVVDIEHYIDLCNNKLKGWGVHVH